MLQLQVILFTTTILTFFSCFLIFKTLLRYFNPNDQGFFSIFHDLDKATDIMEPSSLIAFVVGLILSLGALVLMNSGSEL